MQPKTKTKGIMLLLLLTLLTFSNTQGYGGVGGYPINPTNKENPGWFVYELKEGESVEDTVRVTNGSTRDFLVDIYPSDSINSAGGGFDTKKFGEEQKGIGKWITINEKQIKLKAGEVKDIKFKLEIPRDNPPGEDSGGIMFERKELNGDKIIDLKKKGINISLRTGVRVYNRNLKDLREKISLVSFDINKKIKGGSYLGSIFSFFGNMEVDSGKDYILLHSIIKNDGNISINTIFETKIINAFNSNVIKEIKSNFMVNKNSTFENNIEFFDMPFLGKINIEQDVSFVDKRGNDIKVGKFYSEVFVIPIKEIIIASIILSLIFLLFYFRRKKMKKDKLKNNLENNLKENLTNKLENNLTNQNLEKGLM